MFLFSHIGIVRRESLEYASEILAPARALTQHADVMIVLVKAGRGKALVREPHTVEYRGVIILKYFEIKHLERRTVHPVKAVHYVLPVPGLAVLTTGANTRLSRAPANTLDKRKALQGIFQWSLVFPGDK